MNNICSFRPARTVASMMLTMIFSALVLSSSGAWAEDALFEGDDEFEETSALEIFAEVQLRQDAVRDLPRPIDNDFDRTLLRARFGLLWSNDYFDAGLIAKINQNTDDNSDSRENLDNERADAQSIDSAFVTYRYSNSGSVTIGQAELPLNLSEALWDQDLRPRGISLQNEFAIGDYSMLSLTLGTYEVNHVFDDDAELDAAQLSFFFAEGAPTSYSAHLAYLSFSDLDNIVSNRIGRTNSRTAAGALPSTLAEDFKLIDLQFEVSFNQLSKPVRLGLDLIRNTKSRQGDAARFELVLGDSQGQQGWELGLSTQRIQQDAVIAAFADDDWWFNTNVRGTGLSFAYGFNESLRLRAALFSERRDDQNDNNRRALLELQWSL